MTKGGFSTEFLDEVRAKTDIVDVASKYMTLNRRGAGIWACCPFHHEKTPSFSIKEDGQFYKCFGCGESGNVFTLTMKMENVDFMTAVEMLAKNAGLELPSNADNEEVRRRKIERDKAYQVLKATTEFYYNNLINNENSLQCKYLKKRGINQDMIDKFQIGASLNYDGLPKHLASLGFKPDEMISAGVVGRGEHGLYDFYGTRLLFPIMNGFGDVVAYSGRSVDDNPAIAKYKNTPQTVVFNKSEILFAYNFVRELKKQQALDTIVIVEGHIDVIACHQAGITNAIGCMGTALTTQHARKIKQLVENVILCLDGDSAGANATYKAINTLKEVGLNVKVVRLKNAKDPDEFIKKFGKDNFLEELATAIDCVDFILKDSALKYNLNDNADRKKYIDEALEYISKFSTPAEQEIYLGVVQKLVRVPIDALRKSLKTTDDKRPIENQANETRIHGKNNFIVESKIMILASMLYKKITNFEEISGLFETKDELSDLYEFLLSKIKDNANYNVSTLFDNFDINQKSLIDRVINYNFPDEDVFLRSVQDTIKRVKRFELEQLYKETQEKLLSCQTDSEKYACLDKLKDLNEKIKKEKQC